MGHSLRALRGSTGTSWQSRYRQPKAFDRLLLLIATIVHHPGVGYLDRQDPADVAEGEPSTRHDAGLELARYVQNQAKERGFTDLSASAATLHKDLEALRHYGILNEEMYRWGYYLGTGGLTQEELRCALSALQSQAEYQRDFRVQSLYQNIIDRLGRWGKNLTYPLRVAGNRPILETDPTAPQPKANSSARRRRNMLSYLNVLETAILKGQKLRLYRYSSPFDPSQLGPRDLWPLQFRYDRIAWYLIHENTDRSFAMSRLDRFADQYDLLDAVGRGQAAQRHSLQQAEDLLNQGWGRALGQTYEEQQQELNGQTELIAITARFWGPASHFIREGEKRHRSQRVTDGPIDPTTRQPEYVDYWLKLPRRSIPEFSHWLHGYAGKARVIAPDWLVAEHRAIAEQHLARFNQID